MRHRIDIFLIDHNTIAFLTKSAQILRCQRQGNSDDVQSLACRDFRRGRILTHHGLVALDDFTRRITVQALRQRSLFAPPSLLLLGLMHQHHLLWNAGRVRQGKAGTTPKKLSEPLTSMSSCIGQQDEDIHQEAKSQGNNKPQSTAEGDGMADRDSV